MAIQSEEQHPLGDSANCTSKESATIHRREGLSYDDFVREYLKPNKPVIITDAIREWKALSKWTPDFFKTNYGSMKVTVDEKQYSMSEFIDMVLSSNSERPSPYLRNQCIADLFPELFQDIDTNLKYFTPNWLNRNYFPGKLNKMLYRFSAPEIYIGGTGTKFPIVHFDGFHTHAFINHIYGKKEFVAYSPAQTTYMYPKKKMLSVSAIDDLDHPDLSKFPLFANAVPMRFQLLPGETLFVPSGWWHTARILSPSISVSVNVANSSNWKDLSKDVNSFMKQKNRIIAIPIAAYLRGLGFLLSMVGF